MFAQLFIHDTLVHLAVFGDDFYRRLNDNSVYDATGSTPGKHGDACMSVSQSPVFSIFPSYIFKI